MREANEENIAQNKALSAAFDEIAKKNADITASIHYAQRIQSAILPPMSEFDAVFAKYFVLFKPRDIVSGDFYWLRSVETERGRTSILAVIDCTGHGVPGAFMSMIGHDLLNEILMLKQIYKPSEMLKALDFSLKEALRQKDTSVNDGMDMVLCTIFHDEKKLLFSGAKNDLYMVENNEIKTIKGDNFSVGGKSKTEEKAFTDTEITTENCIFYLSTDGYQDQFGGKENRKFTSKRLKKLILENSYKDFHQQKIIFDQTYEAWRKEGNEKQIDDVLLVGFMV